MTLTVCVGSSGSGKTTFLNDVHKSHKCIYIRQYHNMRPNIVVAEIPNFDPTRLPYWDIYVREEKADSIQAGGFLGGKFTAGLSGGQRKLLLFELICQRTVHQNELLICLDEPFAGVTDDFVPFIVQRLEQIRQKHNVLLVTNDHVETLTHMADNTITVSAIDRSTVQINRLEERVDRENAIQALGIGDCYQHDTKNSSNKSADAWFFYQTEIRKGTLGTIAYFATFTFGLFLLTFWDSNESSAPLVLVAGGIITYFSINPYLISLVGWREAMIEEAEALIHSSEGLNKILKTFLTLSIIFILSLLEYGIINAVIDGLSAPKFWVAMFFDSGSLIFPHICLGIYSRWAFSTVQVLAGQPFLLMIFLSTTFSPGAGIPVIKELRYLWARFYFWCMVPAVAPQMEGCPENDSLNVLYLVLCSLVILCIFTVLQVVSRLKQHKKAKKKKNLRESLSKDVAFKVLQIYLFGERVLDRSTHDDMQMSDHDRRTLLEAVKVSKKIRVNSIRENDIESNSSGGSGGSSNLRRRRNHDNENGSESSADQRLLRVKVDSEYNIARNGNVASDNEDGEEMIVFDSLAEGEDGLIDTLLAAHGNVRDDDYDYEPSPLFGKKADRVNNTTQSISSSNSDDRNSSNGYGLSTGRDIETGIPYQSLVGSNKDAYDDHDVTTSSARTTEIENYNSNKKSFERATSIDSLDSSNSASAVPARTIMTGLFEI